MPPYMAQGSRKFPKLGIQDGSILLAYLSGLHAITRVPISKRRQGSQCETPWVIGAFELEGDESQGGEGGSG